MKVAILIPTRGDLDLLHQACTDLAEHTGYADFYAVIVFDGARENCKEFDETAYNFPIEKHYTSKVKGYISTLNKAYKYAVADLFISWNDDTKPSEGWLTAAVERYQAAFPAGGGILTMNDGYWEDRLATQSVVDEKFIDLCGYPDGCIRFPGYYHYGSDNEITAIAKARGCFSYAEDIRIYHPTPLEKQGTENKEAKLADGELWRSRRANIEEEII